MVQISKNNFKSLTSISKLSIREYERASQGELCFEYLKFQSCAVQAKFGISCPYAHSLYELHKYKSDNRDVYRKPSKFNADRVHNPDEPNGNHNLFLPKLLTKLDLC